MFCLRCSTNYPIHNILLFFAESSVYVWLKSEHREGLQKLIVLLFFKSCAGYSTFNVASGNPDHPGCIMATSTTKLQAATANKTLATPTTAATTEQYFSLRWNHYQTNLSSVFHQLLESQSFVDVSLACEEHTLQAHKVRKVFLFGLEFLFTLYYNYYIRPGRSVLVFHILQAHSAGQSMQTSDDHHARGGGIRRFACHR